MLSLKRLRMKQHGQHMNKILSMSRFYGLWQHFGSHHVSTENKMQFNKESAQFLKCFFEHNTPPVAFIMQGTQPRHLPPFGGSCLKKQNKTNKKTRLSWVCVVWVHLQTTHVPSVDGCVFMQWKVTSHPGNERSGLKSARPHLIMSMLQSQCMCICFEQVYLEAFVHVGELGLSWS